MTLARYVERRNGVALGSSRSLHNMLRRSFGASSFAGFWRFWNPIFGYALARYVHSPLKRWFPNSLAIVLTFAVCGAAHDLVTTLVRGSIALFFTPWFVCLAIGVVLGSAARMSLSGRPWLLRATVNSAYLATALAASMAIRRALGMP